MDRALYERDVAAVYRLLRDAGMSHRAIAAQTGQAQSEVSEILSGRQVISYDTLVRIADGLGVPRGRMGLAGTERPADPGSTATPEDEDMRRRELLALAAAAVVGAELPSNPYAAVASERMSALESPTRVGLSDVAYLKKLRDTLNQLNEQFGATSQHQAAVGLWHKANGLLKADMSDYTRQRLLTLCAQLGHTVGWSSADTGRNGEAQDQFRQALGFAQQAREPLEMTRTLSFAARSELQWGNPNHALKLFQFGDVAAQRAGSHLLSASLKVHAAQATAVMGHADMSRDLAARAVGEYDAVTDADPASWYPWGDIATARAAMNYALGDSEASLEDMGAAMREVPAERVRAQAFRSARLALFRLGAGDRTGGIAAGHAAVEAAQKVRSARVLGRLAPIAPAAERAGGSDGRALAREVRTLISAQA